MYDSFFKNMQTLTAAGEKKILLAVSGGMDSVAMLHLFTRSPYKIGITHCNFQLRGAASDDDETYVRTLGDKYEIPVFTKRFETAIYAKKNKLSVQVAARNLRYAWFESIRKKEGFQLVATAHHLDDSFETLLFNLANETGIRGLAGIPPKRANIIRPLLFASKEKIRTYVLANKLEYREDASNISDKYDRNLIRHKVVPELRKVNPALYDNLKKTFNHLRNTVYFFDFSIQKFEQEICHYKNGIYKISIKKLCKIPGNTTLLFELIKGFGFNTTQVINILNIIENGVGKEFLSDSHHLLIDREYLLIRKHRTRHDRVFLLHENTKELELPDGKKIVITQSLTPPDTFSGDPAVGWFDSEKLKFPIRVRKWAEGDYFVPLGLRGKRQKLKKFFVNIKCSRFEKENTWILESAGKIAWIAGWRMSELFKIDPESQGAIKIEFR